MEPSAQVLCRAMEAYVLTFPSRDRLRAHIAEHGLESYAAEIDGSLDACLKTAEDFLYKYPGGVPWTKSFKKEFESLLMAQHPWLEKPAMDRVFAFAGWLCWHEGLNSK
jgi:hypothetical protein